MQSPVRATLTDAAYRAQQYAMLLQCLVAQRIVRAVAGVPLEHRPDVDAAVRRRYQALLESDLDHVARGDYPASLLFGFPFAGYARRLPALAVDLPRTMRRRARGDYQDLPGTVDLSRFPAYFRRNFHWQSDGYFSLRSARLYDPSVEMLFFGVADVMRRQVIPPIARFLRASGTAAPRVLDVACGTGRTLKMLHDTLPEARLWGLDLSPFYVQVAREVLARVPEATLLAENAESMPLAGEAFDVVTSTFLFHELPRNARRRVLAEMHRVVRPGGLVVIEDSAQHTDGASIGILLDAFPEQLHEPFHRDYAHDDLSAALVETGFSVERVEPAFVAKVVVARRGG